MHDSEGDLIKQLVEKIAHLSESDQGRFLDENCPPDLRDRVLAVLERLRSPTPETLRPAQGVIEQADREIEELHGDETIGAYRIIRRLGEGGMAIVYLAEHTTLRHHVALKVLPRLFVKSPERVARFRSEAKLAANLKHRNIVAVHDVGEARDLEFLVMDYVAGPTLAQQIEIARLDGRDCSDKAFMDEQVRLVLGVADALHFAHGVNVVHRDVKPSNILVEDGEARLTDFGIARTLHEPSTTATGHIVGSVAYMSPEQAMAATDTDPRSDIFSLGVVLYEALTLRQPFRAASIEQSIRNVVGKTPDRLRSVNSSISRDLELICAKAMEKNPAHRYPTAAHMAGDLRCYLEGRPILASPASPIRVALQLAHKHRRTVAATTIVAACLTIVVLILNEMERRRAERCTLDVHSPAEATAVRLIMFDERFEATDAGAVPPGHGQVALTPGHYRLICATADGAFCEASILAHAGSSARLELRPRQLDADDLRDMVLIRGDDRNPDFYVDKREVSNAEYWEFVRATDRALPIPWNGGFPNEYADRPVVGVSFEDAQAFARWRGKRLPTAREWAMAMQSPDGRAWPWGTNKPTVALAPPEDRAAVEAARAKASFAAYLANTRSTDSDPQLSTPLGIHHAVSNVREYTDTTANLERVMIKGAGWADPPHVFDSNHSWWQPVTWMSATGRRASWSVQIGFRCAKSAHPPF